LYDALFDMMDPERVERYLEKNVIEIAPIAFMRGRTLNDSFVILDEAQNTTSEQMKMFVTRLGFGSKAVITGDVTQIDLAQRAAQRADRGRRHSAGRERNRLRALRRERRGAPSPGAEDHPRLRRAQDRLAEQQLSLLGAEAGYVVGCPEPPRNSEMRFRSRCAKDPCSPADAGRVAPIRWADNRLGHLSKARRGSDGAALWPLHGARGVPPDLKGMVDVLLTSSAR
jgi:hypothetical protein